MANDWKPYPIQVVDGVSGSKAAIPTEYDVKRLANKIECAESNLRDLERGLENGSVPQMQYDQTKMALDILKNRMQVTKKTIEAAQGQGEIREYYILPHTFAEVLDAEDKSRDWIGGEPVVNNGAMVRLLLGGHVKLGDTVLYQKETDHLEPSVAQSLGNELYGMANPDLASLPIWSPPSKT